MRKLFILLTSCAVLGGCGGDSGSSTTPVAVVGGSPTPTPSPTPSPTPTPTSGVTSPLNTGEVKPATDALYIAASMDLMTTGGVSETNGIITGGMTSNRVTTFDTPGFTGSYNAGYRLADAINAVSFGQAQLTSDTTRPNGNGVVLFTKNGPADDYLALYQQTTYSSSTKASGYTAAQYGGTAGWQHTVVNGSTRQTRIDYFAYGTPTPVNSMPHAGTATYTMLTSGNYATDTDLWFLSSSNGDTITVNFSAGTVSGNISLSGQNFYKNVVGGIGYFPVNGSFSGNQASISFSYGSLNTSGSVPGQYHLVFVGPNANEVIITYVMNDGTQAAVGAAVGVKDPNFN